MRLRGAERTDLEALAAIHARSFEPPWSAAELAALLASPGVAALVAEEEDAGSLGFIMIRTVAGEAEVLTVAVHPDWRGRGTGRALVAAAAVLAEAAGAQSLFLEVAVDNAAALAVYHSLKFEAAGVRRAYYKRPQAVAVDARILRLTLNSQ